MPILSRKDLERISRRVLFRYLTLSDRKMDRIDPVDFAEKICGRLCGKDLRSSFRVCGYERNGLDPWADLL